MKYFININQSVLSKTELDIKDAAILDYIRNWCQTDDKNVKQVTITENGQDLRYTWINFKHLIKEMPLLKIKSKSSISERIKKIEKFGYIRTFIAPDKSLYIRLMPKIKELEFSIKSGGVRLNEQGVRLNEQGVFVKTNSTNNILINNNINNNTATRVVAGKKINEIINCFSWNPAYRGWFSNKTQRRAIEELLKITTEDKLKNFIEALPELNAQKYAPTTTTPKQLLDKWSSWEAFFRKKRSKNEKVAIII